MPQENIELTQRIFGAFNRRDFDAAFALLDDSIAWWSLFSAEADLFQGKEALRAQWTSQVEAVDVYIELQELISVGESRVVAVAKWSGRGRASGTPVDASAAQVFTTSTARSCASKRTRARGRPSKPSACRSKTLTPTPPDLLACHARLC
jgi:ketosteroid isomerase-like protein